MRTYDTVLSRYFERLGVRVINTAAAMELCKNKMLTHEVLAAAGLPTPATVYAEGAEYAYPELAERFGSARFIVKRTDGAKGEDVYLVNGARRWPPPWSSADGTASARSSSPKAAAAT